MDNEEDMESSNNWKALNVIFNGVSLMQFKGISATESAKEAWDILQIKFEGINVVRKSWI